ncbi:unnamed protein product [Mytilus coruscus]|uniref:Uncharacterized protein n=1 Tax=Mytilus coruscus TaxID=42192 RepID=A0A6J8C663_MYTCO|nr:unnamed protein product [Mytilus coruscus]
MPDSGTNCNITTDIKNLTCLIPDIEYNPFICCSMKDWMKWISNQTTRSVYGTDVDTMTDTNEFNKLDCLIPDYGTCTDLDTTTEIKEFNMSDCFILGKQVNTFLTKQLCQIMEHVWISIQPQRSKGLTHQTVQFQVSKSIHFLPNNSQIMEHARISIQPQRSKNSTYYRTCKDFNTTTEIKEFNLSDCFILGKQVNTFLTKQLSQIMEHARI